MSKIEERQVVKLCDDLADVIVNATAALAELNTRHNAMDHDRIGDDRTCERCNLRRRLSASLFRLKEKINAG